MKALIQSLNESNARLLRGFNDVFSPADVALSEHRKSLRRFPVGELMDSDLDTDWGSMDAMPNGEKNWLEQ
jgi:hypothetical protein